MAQVTYEVVEHDGGWAYRVGPVFSETFPTHDAAHRAAEEAAKRQQVGGVTEAIEYEDADGNWHTELAEGGDRPATGVEDDAEGDAEDADQPASLSRDVGAEEPLPRGPRH
jgi:hypothetical protein